MRWIVLIVDDHPLVGQAFELSIRAAYPHLDVGRVTTAAEAETYVRLNGPRVKLVLLDLLLPDAEGFSALLQLQQLLPNSAMAIVSSRADSHSVAMARAFGARAYLTKSAPVEVLVNAVGALMRGEEIFPPDTVADPVVVDMHRKMSSLSKAQMRVLRALAEGKLNKQIAGDMDLTEGTVKQHVSAILRKLEVNNRAQAILAAAPVLKSGQG